MNYNYGGGFPTGRSPMVLDLTGAANAISDRMIRQEKERLMMEKSEIAKNEAAILQSLQFETIQGLSDNVQREHLNNLSNLWDKWAGKFAENDGKLSMPDMAELMGDKRQVESRLATMKTDVDQIKEIREILIHPEKYPDVDVNKTLENYRDYITNGKVGTGGAFNLIVEREKGSLELIQTYFPEPLKLLESRRNEIIMNPNMSWEAKTTSLWENKEAARKAWQGFIQHPNIKPFVKPGDEEQFMNIFSYDLVKEKPHRPYASYGSGTKPPTFSEQSVMTANEVLEKFVMLDRDIINSMVGKSLYGFGTIKGADVKAKGKSGEYEIVLTNPDGEQKKFTVNPNLTGESRRQEKLMFATDILPIFGKTDWNKAGFQDRIEGDWELQSSYTPSTLTITDNTGDPITDDTLERWIRNPKSASMSEGTTIYNVQKVMKYISELSGQEGNQSKMKSGFFGIGNQKKTSFEWNDYTYDLTKKSDQDKLIKDIQEVKQNPTRFFGGEKKKRETQEENDFIKSPSPNSEDYAKLGLLNEDEIDKFPPIENGKPNMDKYIEMRADWAVEYYVENGMTKESAIRFVNSRKGQ